MSRQHPYYDDWEPEPPYEEPPSPQRRWLLLIVGVLLGGCLVVACAAGGYYLLQPVLARPTLPPPPVIPTLPGADETATAAAAADEQPGDDGTPAPDAETTPEAAATVTLPAQAGEIVVDYAATAPQIDGNLDEWDQSGGVRSAYRVYAYSGWDGSSDLDAVWYLAWDEGRLYVAVRVTDDVHVQTQQGALLYQGDSVEIQIDINPEANASRVNPATSQIILSPGNFGDLAAGAARFRGSEGGDLPFTPGHSIEVAAQETADGYVLEAAIPWADVNLTPAAGTRLGVALNANDNDSPGVARQEVMMSSAQGRTLTNPSTWGTMVLQAP